MGVLRVGPVSLGSASADLIRPDGGSLPLFGVDTSLAQAFGVEAHLGGRLASRLFAEVTGSWVRGKLRAEIPTTSRTGPIADGLSRAMSRSTLEGALVADFTASAASVGVRARRRRLDARDWRRARRSSRTVCWLVSAAA